MDVYSKHRWLVYKRVDNAHTPFWQLTGTDHMTEWEAVDWAQANLDSGTTYRIVEVWWSPYIETIKEMTKA